MSKYICSKCQYTYVSKLWKCSHCWEYWTINLNPDKVEEKWTKWFWKKIKYQDNDIKATAATLKTFKKEQKENKTILRLESNNSSFNDFFGWWLACGSINLISGEPWVWKSTFLGYIPKYFPKNKVLYISWEETTNQILDRVHRMDNWWEDFNNLIVYYENSLEQVLAIINKEKPDILIIDSLQTLKTINSDWEESWMKQQKYITKELVNLVKNLNLSTFLIWHLTTNWDIAGAKFIEHYVDSVIKIEAAGERGDDYKFMKNLKNRFSWEDLLVYEMYENSINIVSNKKLMDLFVQETALWFKWNTLSAITLPNANQIFLVEIQAILSESENYAKNNINNFNKDQFMNLTKIIWDNIDWWIYKQDVSINIVSPLKYNWDEIWLWIIMAIISHARNYILDNKVFIWRVWFRWEIKSVNRQKSIIQKLIKYWVKKENIISNENFKNIRDIIISFNKDKSINNWKK